MPPQMTPLQSSNLASCGVDGEDLYVSFLNGRTYKVVGGAVEYDALVNAGSAGGYYNNNIKDGYTVVPA
jgi:hypothetical protein